MSLTLGFVISFVDPMIENRNLIFIFFCGYISICGITIPGLSGSFLLIILGNYKLVLIDSVNNLDNITTIMVAHRLSSVKNCDNIFLLEGGKLKSQGTYDELSQNDDFFNKMSKINT